MHEMLAACQTADGAPPEVEAVHQLRTGTRRVEATLETLAREAGARGLSVGVETVRQRWLRQLKKVRRAAGVVRDLDVHRELLTDNYLPKGMDATGIELAEATTSASTSEPDEASLLMAQARSLDAWLKARRRTAADALRDALRGRDAKLIQAEQAFVAAFSKRAATRRTHRPAARLALEDYLRLMDAMPELDATNLHDFRKGAKKARYVAEAGGEEPAAVAMTKAIKRVQDAIGDWHDWEVLAEESRQALGDTGITLEKELDRRVKQAYQRALRTAATMGRRFVGEWQASSPRRPRRARVTSRKSS